MSLQAEQRLSLLSTRGHVTDQAATSHAGRLARALLRYAATETGSFSEATNWIFSRSSSGQPQVENPGSRKIWISFSHSGDWVACGLTTAGPIGIDIEAHKADRNLTEIAKLGFGPYERQRCQDNIQEFYRIWTCREAIAKATGAGLVQATDHQDYADTGPQSGSWRTGDQAWDLTHMFPVSGLSLACAIRADGLANPKQPTVHVLA